MFSGLSAFWTTSSRFCSDVLQCGAWLQLLTLNYWAVSSFGRPWLCSQWRQFSNRKCVWVWHCTSSIFGSIVFAMQDQVVLYLYLRASGAYTCYFGRTSVFVWASSLQNLTVPHDFYSPLKCLCGTILLTLYSMVWDWRVSRALPMLFIGQSCSLSFRLLPFYIRLLSFYIRRLCGSMIFGLIGCKTVSPSLLNVRLFNNNKITCTMCRIASDGLQRDECCIIAGIHDKQNSFGWFTERWMLHHCLYPR